MGESDLMEEALQRLRRDADKCRELAFTAVTEDGREVLGALADQYEQKAIALERAQAIQPRRRPAFKWEGVA